MKFLLDSNPARVMEQVALGDIVIGQLNTPLSRRSNWGGLFAIDNGAFARFDLEGFKRLQAANFEQRANCLFVACPDIVGNAARTMELWEHSENFIEAGYKRALVMQDGVEFMRIPWDELDAVFIGGRDPWKDSVAVADIVKTAKMLGKWVHIGRVNTYKRFEAFSKLGADSCDGSGCSRFDGMIDEIRAAIAGGKLQTGLFDADD